jgi:poly(A) polymerase
VAQPREVLDPLPLLTGEDLLRHGIPPGPQYRALLQRLREAQLDGEIRTQAEALELADRLRGKDEG